MIRHEEIVRVFDTTLRDGEQTPGVSLTPEEKLEIARQLDKLGVDTIEAGFPMVSKGEIYGVKMIAEDGLTAEICGLARVDKADIDAALNCKVQAIHTFIATSDIHLKHKLKITRDQALRKALEGVEYAKSHGVTVEFSAEDASRTDPEFLKEVFIAACDAGADRIDIPDTVGVMIPDKIKNLVSDIKSICKVPISVHCHNDFGLAVANTLAAIEGGASQAHLTVNGLGERAGNASLEEVVIALHYLCSRKTRINTRFIYETSLLVNRLTGVSVQPHKAITGDNAFGHKSGIHTHGVLSQPLTYEPIAPEIVGRRRWIQAGKHAGSHGVYAQLQEMGIETSQDRIQEIVAKVKDLGDKGKILTDSDLAAIARSVVGRISEEKRILEMIDFAVMTGVKMVPTASVKLVMDGKTYVASETGVGPVDCAVKAIQKITSSLANITLKEYRIEAITGGSDALAEIVVKVGDKEGNMASSRYAGEDVVVASVEAMIDAINRILLKRSQSTISAISG